jgi:hypothetical protein
MRGFTEGMANSTDRASPIAILLHGGTLSCDEHRLAEILDFFGIPWAGVTISEAKGGAVASVTAGRSRFSILTSAPCLAEVLLSADPKTLPGWLTAAASAFVYGFQPNDACRNLLRDITGDPEANVCSLDAREITVAIADDFPEMCGPMSSVQMPLESGAADTVFTIRCVAGEFQSIVAAVEGHLFAGFIRFGVPFFCDASQTMVDIHQRCASYFDVKKCFAGAVPLVMYLKWSFHDICWTSEETSACLIIDDPLLKPRYGFLDFRELLQLMNAQKFAMTIAFIPWNWRRTNRSTVATFQQNSDKLSICVHGCDHSRGEFATRSADLLDKMLKTAKHRMNSLLERTALHHDQVMVFPQGAFSPEVGLALKGNGFVAAVNTDVAPANKDFNETTIADLWSIANLRYGGFPIFTRRYINHGIENFAFDGLLGKPCFIVGHHEVFRDHGGKLLEFVGKIKSLKWNLCWRTLGSAVCHSYSIQRSDGTIKVKMFAERLMIENKEVMPRQITVLKEEADVRALKSVTVNQGTADYEYKGGCLQFLVNVASGGTAEIRCSYHEKGAPSENAAPISERLKVAARRYLSEFRDNYVSCSDFLRRTEAVAKWLLK